MGTATIHYSPITVHHPAATPVTELRTIDLIAGARPNFMKIAAIIDALRSSGNV